MGSLDWISGSHVTRELAIVRYTCSVIIEIVGVGLKHRNQIVQIINSLRCLDA